MNGAALVMGVFTALASAMFKWDRWWQRWVFVLALDGALIASTHIR